MSDENSNADKVSLVTVGLDKADEAWRHPVYVDGNRLDISKAWASVTRPPASIRRRDEKPPRITARVYVHNEETESQLLNLHWNDYSDNITLVDFGSHYFHFHLLSVNISINQWCASRS